MLCRYAGLTQRAGLISRYFGQENKSLTDSTKKPRAVRLTIKGWLAEDDPDDEPGSAELKRRKDAVQTRPPTLH